MTERYPKVVWIFVPEDGGIAWCRTFTEISDIKRFLETYGYRHFWNDANSYIVEAPNGKIAGMLYHTTTTVYN